MKKLLLASAIAALSVSAANAAPTVYGTAYLALDYVDIDRDIAPDNDTVEINSHSSRVGFRGSEAVTANTDVIYQLEYGVDIDGDDDRTFRSRDTYLGLANNTYGELRLGRNQSSTDRINNVVTASTGYWDNLGSAHNMVDSTRLNNTAIWTAPRFEGVPLEFSAMYAADESDANSEGWGAALMYDQGLGFTAGIAYEDDLNLPTYGRYRLPSGRDDEAGDIENPDVDRDGVGGDLYRGTLSFDLAKLTNNANLPLTIGLLYQEADFDGAGEKEKGYIVSAEWALQNLAKPAEIYAQYNNTSDLRGLDGADSDQIVVGGRYHYKPNMIAHAYAGYNDSDVEFDPNDFVQLNGGTETFNIGAALEYKF